MSDPIFTARLVFFALLGFFLAAQAAATIIEIQTAEKSDNTVPEAFAAKVSVTAHNASVAYTAHVIQYEFLNALVAAVLCLLLTMGGGFAYLTAVTDVVWGAGNAGQYVLAAVTLGAVVLLDYPCAWLKGERLDILYGHLNATPRERFVLHTKRTIAGLLTGLAALWLVLTLASPIAPYWWIAAWIGTLAVIAWNNHLGPMLTVARNAALTPMPEGPVSYRLRTQLAAHGVRGAELMLMERPAGWREGNAYLSVVAGTPRLVVFRQAYERLTDAEFDALVAWAAAPVVKGHRVLRTGFYLVLATLVWVTLGYCSMTPAFYEALCIPAHLALADGVPRMGLVAALLLVAAPIVLYPLIFVLHGVTRTLAYAADRYAVRWAGADALIGVIVKLHNDSRHSLTPNALYSLANHRRPHVTLRVRAAQKEQERLAAR